MLFSTSILKLGRSLARFSSSIEKGAAPLSPLATYTQLVAEKKIKKDEMQLRVVNLIDTLSSQMKTYNLDVNNETPSPREFILFYTSKTNCLITHWSFRV